MARRKRGRDLHGILLFDKPAGGSSNQVMQRVRRGFDANKAGHTGSLDPLATGMLPICFGEATKLSRFLIDAAKGYETTLKLGVTTDSADADGEIIEQRAIPNSLDTQQFNAIVQQFRGDQMQVPPMVSAIKINGQRLYKLAREGKTVEREPRAVTFHEVKVLSFDEDHATLSVRCSKGTYIRSLVTDIGEKIGCGAHVVALRRTFVSPFEGHTMWTEAQLDSHTNKDELLLPVDAGLGHLPEIMLDNAEVTAFKHGQAIAIDRELPEKGNLGHVDGALYRVYEPGELLLGLAELTPERQLAPKRVLQMG